MLLHGLAPVAEDNGSEQEDHGRVDQGEENAGDLGPDACALIWDNVGEVVLIGGVKVVMGSA